MDPAIACEKLMTLNAGLEVVTIPPSLRERAGGSKLITMTYIDGLEYKIVSTDQEVDKAIEMFVDSLQRKRDEVRVEAILTKMGK